VQIAKAFGAEVTGVVQHEKSRAGQSLAPITSWTTRGRILPREASIYDLIVDSVGTHSLLEYRRVLNPKGILVIVAASAWVTGLDS